jgi:hypothetical protein
MSGICYVADVKLMRNIIQAALKSDISILTRIMVTLPTKCISTP